jgi:tetratricopeptide (TPR) repeat protein
MPTSYLTAQAAPDPRSPWFARVASGYLARGEAAAVLKICLEGSSQYPRYSTGNLILGKCYQALGRHIEALLEFRKVLKVFPDNRTVSALVEGEEEREREGFRTFVEEHAGELKEKDSLAFETFVADDPPADANSVESLVRQLQGAKRIVPVDVGPVGEAGTQQTGGSPSRIVTPTLAEIYASQREYKAAIEAYKTLQEQRPDEGGRYRKRMAELEDLLKNQMAGGG